MRSESQTRRPHLSKEKAEYVVEPEGALSTTAKLGCTTPSFSMIQSFSRSPASQGLYFTPSTTKGDVCALQICRLLRGCAFRSLFGTVCRRCEQERPVRITGACLPGRTAGCCIAPRSTSPLILPSARATNAAQRLTVHDAAHAWLFFLTRGRDDVPPRGLRRGLPDKNLGDKSRYEQK